MCSLNVIDLFCGCGGFSKGFEQAGFNVRLGIDSWADAVKTYELNFPKAKTINEDITNISIKDLLETANLKKEEVDVIIGGPPCQGFSLSGKRMLDDPRNILYKSFVNIVKDIKPKIFIMENVPGLIRLFNGKVKQEVIDDFTDLGYNVEMQLLSAEGYGVPQQRKRVFFVGVNRDKVKNTSKFIFPEVTHGTEMGLIPIVTSKDAIEDLNFVPDDIVGQECIPYQLPQDTEYQIRMRENGTYIHNHVIILHKEQTKRIIAMVPDGGNYKNLPIELWKTRKVNIAWTRMNSLKPCFTIDTGHNHHFHYSANRVPTVRESARIQSFPDSFRFLGIKTSQLRQVGNAVPPLLAKAIAKEVAFIIERG